LWRLEVAAPEILLILAGIGSDVPFFLTGGTCLGVGRGEEVYALPGIECPYLLLVNPGFAVPTAGAYQRLNRLTSSESPRMIPITLLAANGIRELPLAARNDLESVVLADHPQIARIKLRLIKLGAQHAMMSGSGATVFGVFDNLPACEQAADDFRASGLWSEQVRTVSRQDYRTGMFD
jgi:4-diphosphocytidyl-2-C-methyl-D-erythritol kinase